VDAGRAFAAARLAGNAKLQRLHHLAGGESVWPELAGDREAERIRAAARDVALVMGRAIARAHHAADFLAAGAVVVAHLDGALKPAARSGISGPVEHGFQFRHPIIRAVAEFLAVIEFRRAHDLAGIVKAVRIELVLHLLKGAYEFRAKHELMEFRANDAVAMLAGMRALVFLDHRE